MELTPAQGRELAIRYKNSIVLTNKDPNEIRNQRDITLKQLREQYERAGGSDYIISNIKLSFGHWEDSVAKSLTTLEVETWRTAELKKKELKCASINRRTEALKTLLNWALKHDILEINPLKNLKKLPEIDSDKKVRYLSAEERRRLFSAIEERDLRLRAQRKRTLDGKHRKYLTPLEGTPFADYFKPLVITALNTGIRKNALFSMRWADVDFENGRIHLRAINAKNKQDAVIPMNTITKDTLRLWKTQVDGEIVFPSLATGRKMDNCDKVWATILKKAEISKFRWHDMRHDFASRLVMAGVDLNTVRELLTHSDIKVTLRYAHLAPEKMAAAVEMLKQP